MKTCSRCLEEKPLEGFYRLTKSKDGHAAMCKDCKRVSDKLYSAAARDRLGPAQGGNQHTTNDILDAPMEPYEYYPPACRRMALAIVAEAVQQHRKGKKFVEQNRAFLNRSPQLYRWLACGNVDPASHLVELMIKKELGE